ncbi:MAG: Tat pathway signal protein [Burkholderiaceae bacterium]|nr:Tat pathway signal protein [Burkholderiaceae bacterium]
MTPVPGSAFAAGVIRRRAFVAATPAMLLAVSTLPACSKASDPDGYESVAARIRRADATAGTEGAPSGQELPRELVRFAILAPSSHNTQCWKFAQQGLGITILPDLSRRCPAVDPDDHHVFVTLGCAVENLAHAALAHGLHAETHLDATRGAIQVALAPTAAQASPLFQAIAARQCTRGDYDGKPLSSDELALLERAGTSNGVRVLLLTERAAMERVLEYMVQGNTAQLEDPAFVKELKSWVRFNGPDAVRTGDGLFSVCTGNPEIPAWLGQLAFGWFLTPKGENDKYARQVCNSAGIAVFVGEAADKAHWVEVGSAYERFALQATALGIRNAFLNQPVEVAAVRPPFAAALGLAGQRPDLVVRFGRGPALPSSLRRPVESVMV